MNVARRGVCHFISSSVKSAPSTIDFRFKGDQRAISNSLAASVSGSGTG